MMNGPRADVGSAAALDTSYEPFAHQPEYLELNRSFIRAVRPHLRDLRVLIDIACGVGTLTSLLAAELGLDAGAPGPDGPLRVVGVDLSRRSLAIARESLAAAGLLGRAGPGDGRGPFRTLLVQGSGDRLAAADASADAALVGNAIHLFDDIAALMAEVHRVLRPGGVFAFNTAFYEGGRPEGTTPFYEEWLRQALRYVRQKGARRASAEAEGAVQRRRAGPTPFSSPWLSAAGYRELAEAAGFRVVSLTERTVETSRSYLEAIGGYAEFASAQLRGYPVEIASEALASTVAPALAALGLATVPRSWLDVIAVRADARA